MSNLSHFKAILANLQPILFLLGLLLGVFSAYFGPLFAYCIYFLDTLYVNVELFN